MNNAASCAKHRTLVFSKLHIILYNYINNTGLINKIILTVRVERDYAAPPIVQREETSEAERRRGFWAWKNVQDFCPSQASATEKLELNAAHPTMGNCSLYRVSLHYTIHCHTHWRYQHFPGFKKEIRPINGKSIPMKHQSHKDLQTGRVYW